MAQDAINLANLLGRDIALIDPDPDNTRHIDTPSTQEDIEKIALSILHRGFDPDEAILVRKHPKIVGRFMVTDGHKRRLAFLRALELGAALKVIPTRSEPQGFTEEKRALYRLRRAGKELSPLEAVVDIQRLLGWQWTKAQIADHLGEKPDWVDRCLELAGAPREVREAVRNEELMPTTGRAIARIARQTGEDAGELVTKIRDHAAARGKKVATARDVKAVTERPDVPRTEPPSLCTLAAAALLVWDDWLAAVEIDDPGPAVRRAMNALRERIGAAAIAAAKERMREAA